MRNKDKSRSSRQNSKLVVRRDNREGGLETEITAHLSIPHEGGWGWVVVVASFFSIFILDGVAFTFGAILSDIATDLHVTESLVALINSTAVALYFIGSPLASALINRFGFRSCAMSGSFVCTFSLIVSYFANMYVTLFITYGIIAGFGYALINMSSSLVVGFYFEKLRSLAMAIATCGSSVGVMTLFPANTYLVKLGGWRTITLLHSGMFGLVFFLGMTYKPLVYFQVSAVVPRAGEEDSAAITTTYLPSVSSKLSTKHASNISRLTMDSLVPTKAERLFTAVSNVNFPTVADIVEETMTTPGQTTTTQVKTTTTPDKATTPATSTGQAGPSTAPSAASRMKLTAVNPDIATSTRQLDRMQSIISSTSDRYEVCAEILQSKKKKGCCLWRLLHWEPHISQARPLYRDDVFYEGKLEHLPEYQQSMMDSSGETKTGLEYQMKVSRAATMHDITEDKRGIMTTAMRRVMATMLDVSLLEKYSFKLLCCSGFLTYVGFLVPYVYLRDRNLQAGVDPKHCTLFVSAIGASNAVGRLVLGSLASKMDPLNLFVVGLILAGISTIASDVSYSPAYQYMYCCVFGFSIASVACLRSLIIVSLYGLDKLTSATGMMLIFLGIGNLVSTPIAAVLKSKYGYTIAFYVAGSFIVASGVILIPVKSCALREKNEGNKRNRTNK